jgi:histidinol-phosphate phosphatase family protein
MDKAIFLDKDGTIMQYNTYGEDVSAEAVLTDVLMENQVLDGLRYLQEKGYKLIVVSNQPWVAKKVVEKEQIEDLFKELVLKLGEKGIKIHDYFYCPHQSSDNCECKKPKADMIMRAARKHNIDLENSYMVGDTDQDVGTGKNAKVKTILVLTGLGRDYADKTNPDFIIDSLNEIGKVV